MMVVSVETSIKAMMLTVMMIKMESTMYSTCKI